jgi:NADPH:quinone reductase-like Zn-dependent oxidoreductase
VTRTKKILGAAALVLVAGIAALAVAVSRDAPCGPSAPLASGVPTMKAIIHPCYGKADVLRYDDVAVPQPGDHEVLVEVRAVALNPLDWHYMTGTPYIMRLQSGLGRPRSDRLGVDFAGIVTAVGPAVTRFKPGDEVLGSRFGAFAEYAVLAEDRALVTKPSRLSFEQAAAVPVAAITALQGLRDKGHVKAGDKVLINGASGGVGTFAVQIAKALGAEVTGVCSTRNVELVRSLGADHVIDYKHEDFTRGDRRYDVIIDNVGNHPLRAVRRVLEPDGTHVMIGGPKDDPWLGPVLGFLKAPLMSRVSSQQFAVLLAEMNAADLSVLNSMIEAGQVTPVVDRTYPLQDIPAAIAYLETQRARGKVVAARP